MNSVLTDIYETGKTWTQSNESRPATGGISRREAEALTALVLQEQCRVAVETGVGYGLSTLAISEGLARLGGERRVLYGVDPNQFTEYEGAALAALRKSGLASHFVLLEASSHEALPRLLAQGTTIDLAFIDGWHTFDTIFLDFFYLDKMLEPGGLMLFHEGLLPATRRVLAFIKTHRQYERAHLPPTGRPFRVRSAALILALLRLRVSEFRPRIWELLGATGLVALRKQSDYEPPWTFYRCF